MYSVLLVEDEQLELDTLKNYVDWKKVGIDKVYTARGGRSALAILSEHEPDIMITDIEMPGMDGTELAKLVVEEGHRCKIIFLTGYNKFEYAKAAVQVHAEDYLLKPFLVDEVEELVARILEKVEEERRTQELNRLALGKLIEQACHGQLEDFDTVSRTYFQKDSVHTQFTLVGLYALTMEQRAYVYALPEIIHSFILDMLYVVVLPTAVPARDMIDRLRETWQQDIRAICKEHIPMDELSEQCKCFLRCQEYLFFGEPNMTMFLDQREEEAQSTASDERPKRQDLLQAILNGDEGRARRLLHKSLDSFRSGGQAYCTKSAYSLYLYLRDQLPQNFAITADTSSMPSEPDILHSGTYTELVNSFTEYVRCCCEVRQNRSNNPLVSWVKQYISERYMELCTAEEIAAGVKRSPNYVRKVFKEATGQTILEYLTEVRMNKAAELLRTTHLKVKEVSVRVGYENISYFTQLFSKRFGVTPNEYKKMV